VVRRGLDQRHVQLRGAICFAPFSPRWDGAGLNWVVPCLHPDGSPVPFERPFPNRHLLALWFHYPEVLGPSSVPVSVHLWAMARVLAMSASPSSLERAAARNLVKNYLQVAPDENVIVESWTHTISMASAMVEEVRRVGGRAFLAYEDDDAWWRAVNRNQSKHLGNLSAPEWAALKAADIYVQFWGPRDSSRLEKTPEKNLDEWATGWVDRWYKMARATGLRGGRMAVGWVTDSRARHWGVSKERWMKGVLEGCLADPEVMARSGKRLARAFSGTRKVRITHPNGTDLEVGLAGLPPFVFDGYPHPKDKAYRASDMMANFPEGRLQIPLDAKTAEGRIVSSYPSYDESWFPWARYSGGTFEFSGGKLSTFSFEKGEAAFAARYARGKPGKDRTGLLSIGLNPKIKNSPSLERMERGCVQLVVGANNIQGGSKSPNHTGSVTLAGSEISVDGTPVVRAGKIL
jgi:leucyl aminopeptidase (aminopeptidase T)